MGTTPESTDKERLLSELEDIDFIIEDSAVEKSHFINFPAKDKTGRSIEFEDFCKKVFELFIHRKDAHAKQAKAPNEKGRHDYYRETDEKKAEITNELIKAHLDGKETIGIYQIDPATNTVKWICCDVDGEHSKTPKEDVKKLLSKLKSRKLLHATILEGSGSPDSYHVWLFIEPINTEIAYKFGREVCNEAGVVCEVFPKQEEVATGGFGNLVKLFFGLHWGADKKRSQLLNLETFEPLNFSEAFLQLERIATSQKPKLSIAQKQQSGELPSTLATMKVAFENSTIRYCFKRAYVEKWQLDGAEGDYFRVSAVPELRDSGFSDSEMYEYFKTQKDYDYEITQDKIEKHKGYKRFSCEKLQEHCQSLLKDLCKDCPEKSLSTLSTLRRKDIGNRQEGRCCLDSALLLSLPPLSSDKGNKGQNSQKIKIFRFAKFYHCTIIDGDKNIPLTTDRGFDLLPLSFWKDKSYSKKIVELLAPTLQTTEKSKAINFCYRWLLENNSKFEKLAIKKDDEIKAEDFIQCNDPIEIYNHLNEHVSFEGDILDVRLYADEKKVHVYYVEPVNSVLQNMIQVIHPQPDGKPFEHGHIKIFGKVSEGKTYDENRNISEIVIDALRIERSTVEAENFILSEHDRKDFEKYFRSITIENIDRNIAPTIKGRAIEKYLAVLAFCTSSDDVGMILFVGDPEEAKSSITNDERTPRSLMKLIPESVGIGVSVELATKVGLTSGTTQAPDGRYITRWGLLPKYNDGFVVLDGLHALGEQIKDFREVFTRKKATKISIAGNVSRPCRVRIIGVANTSRPVSDCKTSYDAIQYVGIKGEERLFEDYADVRRWDFIWVFKKIDNPDYGDEGILEKMSGISEEGLIPVNVWNKFFLWVATLKSENFDYNSVQKLKPKILEFLDRLKKQYPKADLPWFTKTRLALCQRYLFANATLHFRINDAGNFYVSEDDLEIIEHLLSKYCESLELEKHEEELIKEEGTILRVANALNSKSTQLPSERPADEYGVHPKMIDSERNLLPILSLLWHDGCLSSPKIGDQLGFGEKTIDRRVHEINEVSTEFGGKDIIQSIRGKGHELTKFGVRVCRKLFGSGEN